MYIEFFEKDAIENVCSCLTKVPEKVIFIGSNRKLMMQHSARYEEVFARRGMNISFSWKNVNKNNLQNIIDVLSSVVEENDDCIFDLTGGNELYLAAVGIVFERYKSTGRIKMHRFTIANSTVVDCDLDGSTIAGSESDKPKLSVEENIRIYGGDIVYSNAERENATVKYEVTDELRCDINRMWNICRENVRLWNTQIYVIGEAVLCGFTNGLSVSVGIEDLKKVLSSSSAKFVYIHEIMKDLAKYGLLTSLSNDGTDLSFTFKNEHVKECLTVAGKVLEMKVFLAACDAVDSDGGKTYNDAMTGVVLDWDGDTRPAPGDVETENEIDVIMMHDMVPVFVSCKNGWMDSDELYKLQSVAEKFGGKYAKKVLVATALDSSERSDYIRQRAEDMSIRLVEGFRKGGQYRRFTNMNDEDMNRVVRSFWLN